ncbi:Sas10 C-terminal domain-containing protein [Myxozyma melibiosi]|uniref:Sas10 C-terminal domain-containing protein n=1 Tax=Myxozyma melibiosi TaxID=54550 RepID=A0ABR1F104_9ASCO
MARRGRKDDGGDSIRRVNTYDEMEKDAVDEFHDQREKILFGDDGASRHQDADMEASDEEVLAMDASSDNESEVEEELEEEYEEEEAPQKPKKSSKKESKKSKTVSATEVSDDDDDDWRAVKQKSALDEADELSGWGTSARAYYNADDVSDEEAAQEEEETARKIQQKMLSDMSAGDFLDDFEEAMVTAAKEEDEVFKKAVRDVVPRVEIEKMSKEEQLSLLRTRNPELFPLSKEYSEMLPIFEEMRAAGDRSVKFVALASYLACISAYFTLFCDETTDENTVRDRQVMNHLLVLRRYWKKISQTEDVKVSTPDLTNESDENEGESEAESAVDESDDEEEEEEEEEEESFGSIITKKSAPSKRKRSLPTIDVDLDLPTVAPLSKKKKLAAAQAGSDFVDPSALDDVDLSDKLTRRKTLRFYTSKIDQKAASRKEKFSGDADLPYREREKERLSRLSQLAAMRGQTRAEEGDADFLDGKDGDEDDYDNDFTSTSFAQSNAGDTVAGYGDGDADSDDGYYDMVKASKEKKKQDKIDLHESIKKAAKEGNLAKLQDEVGEDGKRAINYQILKNKGLTPKRNKDNRNSRVKKRKKYEKAKKKLASMKAIYKPAESAYAGEKTGIKKNVTKSMKFR